MPYDSSLGAMIHDPSFRNLLPEAVFQKARIIQQVGNQAVHEQKPVRQLDAMQVVKELHHLCYWLTRTYSPETSREGAAWSDAGIDVPEIVNLVFFKPVYSKIKFWQMIGRGTRLCKNLFGPDQDKEHFRIFDFCFNFDYFRENPNGIEGSGGEALGTRLFKSRVQLLAAVQRTPELESSGVLRSTLASTLHGEVSGMNPNNFMVRAHLQHVEKFKNAASWESLMDSEIHDIEFHIAGLPSQIETDEIEARFFDLCALRMQIPVSVVTLETLLSRLVRQREQN